MTVYTKSIFGSCNSFYNVRSTCFNFKLMPSTFRSIPTLYNPSIVFVTCITTVSFAVNPQFQICSALVDHKRFVQHLTHANRPPRHPVLHGLTIVAIFPRLLPISYFSTVPECKTMHGFINHELRMCVEIDSSDKLKAPICEPKQGAEGYQKQLTDKTNYAKIDRFLA